MLNASCTYVRLFIVDVCGTWEYFLNIYQLYFLSRKIKKGIVHFYGILS